MIQSLFRSIKRRPKTAGAMGTIPLVLAISLPMVQDHEGLRTNAYLDPVGIPTICFGETLGVKLGQTKSVSECQEMLKPRLQGFLEQMRACTSVSLPAKTEAAFLSFTYNLGPGIYCKNMAQKRINKGNVRGACEALKYYTKAGQPLRVLPGLVKRREEERALCLQGLEEQ